MAPKAGPTARDRLRAVLRRALRSNDVALRVGACAALSVLADPDARRALVRALEDESRLVRIAAAHALVTLDPGGAKKPVRDAIRVEVDADVREALEAVLIGAPWESPLGLALFGERGTEIPNLVILFASGSVIGY
ncbi:MAG: HEAT repeat domain-containing protein [Myxococcales bacterium]|nr:HEAT repeat domain-containing protein [Myxococcales bacterium]